MSKGSRSGDKMWHGIPYYPGSSTPDGRIVGEVSKARKAASEYQKKSLDLQQQALATLSKIHGGTTVIDRSNFDTEGTKDVFFRVANEICSSFEDSRRSTDEGLERLNDSIENGFSELDESVRTLKGPALARTDLAGLIKKETDYYEILNAYLWGILNDNAASQLGNMIDQHFLVFSENAETIIEKLQTTILQDGWDENEKADSDKPDQDLFEEDPISLNMAFNVLRFPRLIIKNPAESAKHAEVLYNYAKKYNQPELMAFVNALLRILQDLQIAQGHPFTNNLVIRLANNRLLSNEAQHEAMAKSPEARRDASLTSLNYHLADLVNDSRENLAHQRLHSAQYDRMITLDVERNGLLDTMIALGEGTNRRLDTIIDQGEELIGHSKTRVAQGARQIAQTNVLINQGAAQLQQSQTTNYNLGVVIENLANLQGEVVDFEDLIKHFMLLFDQHIRFFIDSTEEGFSQIAVGLKDGFKNIALESTLTRLAIVTGFAHIGDIITNLEATVETECMKTRDALYQAGQSIERVLTDMTMHVTEKVSDEIEKLGFRVIKTNNLLQQIIDLQKNSLGNEEKQHFSDGQTCLQTATEISDLDDAYEAFSLGISKKQASIVNHFGAGLTANLQGRLDIAEEHFRKAGQRANKNEQMIACKAFLEATKIRESLGDIKMAINYAKRALNADPENQKIKYKLALLLIQDGLFREALSIFKDLLLSDEDWLTTITEDKALAHIPRPLRISFLKTLWNSELGKTKMQALLVKLFLDEGLEKESLAGLMDVVIFYPRGFFEYCLWEHPFFANIQSDFQKLLIGLAREKLPVMVNRSCYSLINIMFKSNVRGQILFDLLVTGITRDHALYLPKTEDGKRKGLFEKFSKIDAAVAEDAWEYLGSLSSADYLWLFKKNLK